MSSAVEPSRASKVWRRTVVGGGLAAAVAGLLALASIEAGATVVLVLATVLSLWSIHEARRMSLFGDPSDVRPMIAAAVATVAGVLILFGVLDPRSQAELPAMRSGTRYWLALAAQGLVVVVAALVACAPALRAGRLPGPAGRRAPVVPVFLLTVLWLAVPLPGLYVVRLLGGVSALGALLLLSKIGDVAGYYVGSALGRHFPHHPFPVVSPNKTSVGCWGSFLAGTLAGAGVQALGWLPEARFGWFSGLLAGAIVNVAAQSGDLLESAAKRGAGVKDSGAAFGPSGGMLDLVDSLLLSVPAALLSWPLLFRLL